MTTKDQKEATQEPTGGREQQQLERQEVAKNSDDTTVITIGNGLNKSQPVGAASQSTKQILKAPSAELGRGNRKGSTVSFHEKPELHEIDLEKNNNNNNNNNHLQQHQQDDAPKKPAAVFSLRYYVMIVALISPFVVTYSKTIINFAIIDMIHPDFVAGRPATRAERDISLPPLTTITPLVANETIQTVPERQAYYDLDNSCPVSDDDRQRLDLYLEKDQKRALDRPGEKFEWDTVKQGLLKSAYSIGHAMCSIIGGRLSEIFGSQRVMCTTALLIGSCCLMAPFMAATHFYLMFGDLFLLGCLGSFMAPSLITLFSNWLTPSEKSMMISLYLVSSRLGYALSSLLCGLLIQAQLSWRYLFYSAGWVSFIFSTLFFFLAKSKPEDHPFIKQEELAYLASKNTLVREGLARKKEAEAQLNANKNKIELVEMQDKRTNKSADEPNQPPPMVDIKTTTKTKKNTSAPWLAILTCVPVWAFVITKFCVKLAGDTVQIELPTYLNRVMHFSPKANGFVNSSNYIIFCASCLLVGGLAKMANKNRPFGWSKTAVRKLFQCIASFGVSLVLLGISFSVCNNTMTQIFLMMMFFFTTFGTGGEAQIPLDISERYSGTIHAIGSSLAISGAVEPILVGFLLRGHPSDKDSWATVWLGASAIAAFGGMVFLIFGDATVQAFDKIDISPQENDEKKRDKSKQDTINNSSGADNKAFVNGPNDVTTTTTPTGGESSSSSSSSFKESAQI